MVPPGYHAWMIAGTWPAAQFSETALPLMFT